MPNLRGKTWTTTTPANVADAQFWEDHLMSDSSSAKLEATVMSVNSALPDINGNVNVSTIPVGGTTGQLLTKQSNVSGDVGWNDPPNLAHVIQTPNGTDLAYKPKLQFLGADVSNDNVNGKTVVDCHGEKGDPGKSAYSYAQDGGYTKSESQFTTDLGQFDEFATTAEQAASDANDAVEEIRQMLAVPSFTVDFTTGELLYTAETTYSFLINATSGNLEWEVLP